ncbi:MAG: PDZ domain-containing protein [Betaproteobacteria bacterium]|nr:PDZ domain-containing protein [Betaproteobacteria bacterium]
MSFAIPIDVANRIQQQILATGQVRHAKFGVAVQEVDQLLAESFGLPRPAGALVSEVVPGGAAARAGVVVGDVVLAANGETMERASDLSATVGQALPTSMLALRVWRHGRELNLSAQLDDAAALKVAASLPVRAVLTTDRLGLALRKPTADEARDTGEPGGLCVDQVSASAERAGMQVGDRLLAINTEAVTSVEQAHALVTKAGKSVALLVLREGSRIYVPLRLSEQPGMRAQAEGGASST